MEDYQGDLWSGLALHVAILGASWLQLVTYWYLGAQGPLGPNRVQVAPEEASEPLVISDAESVPAQHQSVAAPPPPRDGLDRFIDAVSKLLSALVWEGTVLALYVVVAAVALATPPSLMNVLFVTCGVVHGRARSRHAGC